MTTRTEAALPMPSPDFTKLTDLEAIARVRQLHAQGLREPTLQALTNWNRSDLLRALTPAPASPSR